MVTRLTAANIYAAVSVFTVIVSTQVGQAGWGPWSDWMPCSVTCGNGVQTRIRHCIDDPDQNLKCVFANQTEEYQCDSGRMCDPTDGGWSNWGPWTNCSRRCGIGFHERWRKCDHPLPSYGGKMCNGSVQEAAPCINPACPPLYFGEKQTDCSAGHVHCADGRQCVPEYRRCDFWLDCRDGSDESACREGEPVTIFYNVSGGNCLNLHSITFPFLLAGFTMWFAESER